MAAKNGTNMSRNDFSGALPRHVAFIMDGNGRWARKRLMPRLEGHRNGAKSVRMVAEESRKLGIRHVTLFAFSTENWNRPATEVSGLMELFTRYLTNEIPSLEENGIRLRIMGDRARMPETIQNLMSECEQRTLRMDGMDLILAISYGGRDEIVHATRQIAAKVASGEMKQDEIDVASFSRHLYLPDVPDPDLLIRTSDESRISNFLLWQMAYTEIVVTPVLWPDFSKEEYMRCLQEFAGRSRRFGLTSEQVSSAACE